MKPWMKYLALVIGLLALLAMVTIVAGCGAMPPDGTKSDPMYVQCSDN